MTKKEMEEARALDEKMAADFAARLETMPIEEVEQHFAEACVMIQRLENVEIYKAAGFAAAYELLKRRGYLPPWTAEQVNDILAVLEGRKGALCGDWNSIQ
jgi:hypothetical protein